MDTAAARHLVEQIDHNLEITRDIPARGTLREALDRLQQWQRDRLDATYADLRRQDRFRPACDFFLDDLYGGRDVHARDRQLKRVAPVMRRFLPDDLLFAMGEAMRLQATSLRLDFELAQLLVDSGRIDQPVYAEAFRAHGAWEDREEQLRLVRELGELLDETVARPMVHSLIRLMKAPADFAGVGLLQAFLQRGLDAFAHMNGAGDFLDVIDQREWAALAALRDGDPWPFRQWTGREPVLD